MPYALGAVQVQAGQTYTVPVGSAGTVGAVVCANESPYAVNASISATGAPGQWIVAQTADLIACDVSGFNGSLTFTTDNYLSNAASAPSFLLYLTAFAPGEPIRGTYPAPLMRLANGSIGVATQLVNDGNTVGSNIIESTPAGAVNSYILVRNDGTFQVWAISNNVLTELINLTPGGGASPASLALKLLQTAGALSLDSGNITTDGAGNLRVGTVHNGGGGALTAETLTVATVPALGVPPQLSLTVPGYALFALSGIVGAGNNGGLSFTTIWNGASLHTFAIGDNPLNELAYIDHLGVLHATAPVTLAAGNQETGVGGYSAYAGTIGTNASVIINFKTVMTNVPTSISSSNLATPTNANSLSFNLITKYGFNAFWANPAVGWTGWEFQYTTVGNCLLAVDISARTLDHHCDACGQVTRGASFDALRYQAGATPAETSMSYACPVCSATEHFTCGLTATDEADTSPQGNGEYATTRGAQATLIRQLMTTLGLELAP